MRKVTSDDPYIAESGQGRARKTGRSGPDHDKRRIDRCASKREGEAGKRITKQKQKSRGRWRRRLYYTFRPRNGHFNPCTTLPRSYVSLSLSLPSSTSSSLPSAALGRSSKLIDMRDRAEENDVRHHVTCARETGSRSGRLFVARVGPLLHRSPKEHCRIQLVVIATVCVCIRVRVVHAIRRRDGEKGKERGRWRTRRRSGGYLLVRESRPL